ncbi:transglutaminase-like domain-containing protein [Agrococcus sp. Marseille-P2731]|uniref:transglutaminase-like domain-containing protein n=1 Tax=Agrococcus sp. Marseille-P2731 TaxID=1841862 RepID=UPI000931E1F0|nr:transglutaminase domain-containing protein [Agrococcus sp. Marseille-P2731]
MSGADAGPGTEPDASDRVPRRVRAGIVETVALALLPIGWLWSAISVLGQAWLWPVVVAVGSLALSSALVRSVAPALVGTAAAALVGAGWVTALTAPEEALLAVVPTPDSLPETMRVLNQGVVDIAWAVSTPLDATGPVLAVVVGAAIALTLLIDVVGHGLRVPAIALVLAATPLVLPIAFRLEVPWWHAMPGVILSALVLAAPAIDERAARGRGWLAPIALVGVAAVLSAALPIVAPAPRETAIDLPTLEELFSPATPLLDADIDLGDQLRRPADRPVFTYSTTDGEPILTRLMTLPLAGEAGFEAAPIEPGSPTVLVEGADSGQSLQMTVRMADVRAESLPTPERVVRVPRPEGSSWDVANDALRIGLDIETAGLEYTAAGSRSASLDELPAAAGSSGHDAYLAMPEAAQAIARQGAELVSPGMSAARRVVAVHEFMTAGLWDYSEQLDLPGFGGTGGEGWDALAGFLETRSGYCVHYASATAGLLRGAGVPARVVVGFLPGSEISGGWAVSTNEMHAWAEAWIDGAGWVRVETTPGAGTGAASPEGAVPTRSPTPEPTPTTPPASESPTPSPSPGDSAGASTPPTAPAPSGSAAPGAPGGFTLDPAVVRTILIVLGVLLLLALPAIARAVQRAVRLRRGAPGGWLELRATLADLGARLPASATPGAVHEAIAARSPDAASAADRVRLAAERAVFDAGPREPGAVDGDVRAARRALSASAPRWRQALAALLPPSLLGVEAWERERDA